MGYLMALWVASLWPAHHLNAAGIRVLPDTLEHAIAYGMAALLLSGSFPRRSPCTIWLVLVVMGATIEGAQALTSTRTPSFADVGANALGAGTGLLLVHCWRIIASARLGGSSRAKSFAKPRGGSCSRYGFGATLRGNFGGRLR